MARNKVTSTVFNLFFDLFTFCVYNFLPYLLRDG